MDGDPVTPAPPAPSGDGDLGQRMARVESTLETILDRLKGGRDEAHGAAQDVTQARLAASSTIADEVQQELSRRDAAAKAAERDQLLGKHEETLKALTEQKPQVPVRWVESLMGWR